MNYTNISLPGNNTVVHNPAGSAPRNLTPGGAPLGGVVDTGSVSGRATKDGTPGVVKTKRNWMSGEKIAGIIKKERAKQGLNDLGTGPRLETDSAIEKWAGGREDPATWSQTLNWIDRKVSNFFPGVPGAEAASPQEENVCRLGENCATPTTPAAARTVEFLKQQAANKGFEVRVSPSLQGRADQSLDGVIVLIGDGGHHSKPLRDAMELLITSNWQRGAWLFGPSKDDILVEGKCDRWYLADWNNRYLYGYTCENIEHPSFEGAFLPARDKADKLAMAFISEQKQTPGPNWYVRQEQAAKLYIQMRGHHTQAARDWIKADGEAGKVIDDTMNSRDEHFLSRILEHRGADHATFVVVGRVHADHIVDAVFQHDAVYIRTDVNAVSAV